MTPELLPDLISGFDFQVRSNRFLVAGSPYPDAPDSMASSAVRCFDLENPMLWR
jgi:hypothetical protein